MNTFKPRKNSEKKKNWAQKNFIKKTKPDYLWVVIEIICNMCRRRKIRTSSLNA